MLGVCTWRSQLLMVGIACLSILTGWSVAVRTVPDSGSIIAGSVGDKNIEIFCEVFNGSNQQVTVWHRQLLGESMRDGITADDRNLVFDGEPVPGLVNATFDTNLTILTLNEDLDRAIFFCGAIGVVDEAANFTIRIYRPPDLKHTTMPQSVCEERNGTIDLQAAGAEEAFPFPQEFNWTRDGETVDNTTDGDRVTYGYPSVAFTSFRRTDSGRYVLSAANYETSGSLIGSDTGSFNLNVQYGPDFDDGDDRQAVLEGDSITLVCATNVDSNPHATVQWRDPMGNVVSDGGRYILNNGPEIVSLTIDNVNVGDHGNWSCAVSVSATCGTFELERFIMLTVVADCGTPVPPRNGSVTVTNGTTQGSEAVYVCDAGLVPSEQMTAVCREDRVWDPNPASLTCREPDSATESSATGVMTTVIVVLLMIIVAATGAIIIVLSVLYRQNRKSSQPQAITSDHDLEMYGLGMKDNQDSKPNVAVSSSMYDDMNSDGLKPQEPADKELNLNNVLLQLKEVHDYWYQLGEALGIPMLVLEGISKQSYTPKVSLVEVVDFWLESHTEQPTWQELSDALREVNLTHLSSSIRQIYVTGTLPVVVDEKAPLPLPNRREDTPPPLPPKGEDSPEMSHPLPIPPRGGDSPEMPHPLPIPPRGGDSPEIPHLSPEPRPSCRITKEDWQLQHPSVSPKNGRLTSDPNRRAPPRPPIQTPRKKPKPEDAMPTYSAPETVPCESGPETGDLYTVSDKPKVSSEVDNNEKQPRVMYADVSLSESSTAPQDPHRVEYSFVQHPPA